MLARKIRKKATKPVVRKKKNAELLKERKGVRLTWTGKKKTT